MIVVIDYKMGNLKSISKALETFGVKVKVTNNLSIINQAKALVLPGVGSHQQAMKNLKNLHIIPLIYQAVEEKKPILGICLGLQLLLTESEENGKSFGLNIIEGKVKKFTSKVKIPHMGWNTIKIINKCKLLEEVSNNSYFYFVHSYYVEPKENDIIKAITLYDQKFASIIIKDKILGLQFHPEKSSFLGLKILENFVKYYVN